MSIRSVSKELQAKAIEELNEDVARISEDIKYIKNWIKQTKYLNARTDDQWLIAFLRGCKYSLERTKEKLETYYTLKTMLPEFFSNRDPMSEAIQKVLTVGGFNLPLPKTSSPDSPRIIIMRAQDFDPTDIDILAIMKVNLMIQDILLIEDDQCTIAGAVVIQDMKGFTMGHMVSPTLMKKASVVYQDAYPARPKAFHFLNIPSFFETIYAIFKSFFNEKLKKRMVVHSSGNLDELYETVPKSILPKEYGGDGGTIAEITAEWKKKIESYSNWFKESEKFGTDEKKRPGKPKTSEELFGIEGSFRKLNVD